MADRESPVRRPNFIGMKFDFVARVLADPVNRGVIRKGTQGKRLTTFQGGVLTVLVNRVNAERGYSFAGVRNVARALDAPTSTVGTAIKKLVDLDILQKVDGGKKNRAQRLMPNWTKYLDVGAYGFTVDGSDVQDHEPDDDDHDHDLDDAVQDHGDASPSTSKKRTKRNVGSDPKGKEQKRSGPNRSGSAPAKAGAPVPLGPGSARSSKATDAGRSRKRVKRASGGPASADVDAILAFRRKS